MSKEGYNNSENQQVGGEDCSLCPPNTYQPNSPPYMPLDDIGNEKTDVDGDNNPREPINGVITCISCGIKVSPPGSTKLSDCETCEPNTGRDGGDTCQNCTTGKYYYYGDCKKCQEGKYNDEIGMGECKNCAIGKFQADPGGKGCTLCPAGRYQNVPGQSGCRPCPLGRYNDQTGLPECKLCSRGRYQDVVGVASGCKECQAGQWQTAEGQGSCIPRRTCNRGGNGNNGKVSCSKRGEYVISEPGDKHLDRVCAPCPTG